jgi:hypothetical protein
MRYLLITYVKKANGQIDEQVGMSNTLKERDLTMCSIIVDFKEQTVVKSVVQGQTIPTDYTKVVEYYEQVYPDLINKLKMDNNNPIT